MLSLTFSQESNSDCERDDYFNFCMVMINSIICAALYLRGNGMIILEQLRFDWLLFLAG